MLSVIITILKILGISVLVILGLIIVLLLLILFVPIRYKANGEYKDKKIDLSGRITWLLHIVSVKLFYNNEKPFHIKVCLFGIPLFDNLKKEALKEKRKKNKKKNTKKDLEDTKTEIQVASEKDEDKKNQSIDEEQLVKATDKDRVIEIEVLTESKYSDAKSKETDSDRVIEIEILTESEQNVKEIEEDGFVEDSEKIKGEVSFEDIEDIEKKGLFEKISEKIENIADKIKYTFKKICDTISKIKDNIEYYIQLFQRERTKRAIEKIKKRLLRILKNLKPKKFQLNLHLGFDNPELMGKIMAVNGILYPLHLGKIAIVPEFENEIIEGNCEIKGCVSIYVYVWTAIVVLLDKDIKLLIKRLKR